MKKYSVYCIAFILFFVPYLKSQDLSTVEYRIGARDLLEIRVFGHEDLTSTVRVSEDGHISLPLIKKVRVEGLTQEELEIKLSELFEENYLENPQVSIFIREYRSKMVSVIGAVVNQGQYELLGRQSLVEIVTIAGGITSEAGETIFVTRPDGDGAGNVLEIPIDDLLRGDIRRNIILQPKDIVHVPIDRMIKVYVFGRVTNPGALSVRKSKIPTLLQAIAEAGGFAERAAEGSVKIIRKDENGKILTMKVDVDDIIDGKKDDIQLLEGDTIYVGQSIF